MYKHNFKLKIYSEGHYDEEKWLECSICKIQIPFPTNDQGKRDDQIEESNFFVGFAIAVIISLVFWIAVGRLI